MWPGRFERWRTKGVCHVDLESSGSCQRSRPSPGAFTALTAEHGRQLFFADDPAAAFAAAAVTTNGHIGRPAIVDRQLFAGPDRAQGLQPQPVAMPRILAPPGPPGKNFAVGLATVIQEAKWGARLEIPLRSQLDAIGGAVIGVIDDLAGNLADELLAPQSSQGVHAPPQSHAPHSHLLSRWNRHDLLCLCRYAVAVAFETRLERRGIIATKRDQRQRRTAMKHRRQPSAHGRGTRRWQLWVHQGTNVPRSLVEQHSAPAEQTARALVSHQSV